MWTYCNNSRLYLKRLVASPFTTHKMFLTSKIGLAIVLGIECIPVASKSIEEKTTRHVQSLPLFVKEKSHPMWFLGGKFEDFHQGCDHGEELELKLQAYPLSIRRNGFALTTGRTLGPQKGLWPLASTDLCIVTFSFLFFFSLLRKQLQPALQCWIDWNSACYVLLLFFFTQGYECLPDLCGLS